jgi:hypothetical protein
MHFQAHASGFLKPLPNLSLLNVWDIQPRELSEHGRDVLKVLEESGANIKGVYERLAWTGQAILEFQDLLQIILPESGPFLHTNYLFFQSLDTLRQAVLTGLNGQTHASLAILRSTLENFVFHYWWRSVLLKERTFEAYYAWLRGEPPKIKMPPFARVIADTFARLDLPRDAIDLGAFRAIYAQLCSYVHKPLMAESLTTIRGGNIPGVSQEEILYWLGLMNRTQRALLDLGIGHAPQALFPIEIHRKFGFSTPVGALFDHSNFIPLSEALGADATLNYQKHYESRNPPGETLRWAASHPDLTDEEILNSWAGRQEPDDADEPFDLKVFHRRTQQKAETRAELFVFSNADIDHSFDWATNEGIITLKHKRPV